MLSYQKCPTDFKILLISIQNCLHRKQIIYLAIKVWTFSSVVIFRLFLDTISSSESSQQRDNGNTGANIDGQQNQGSQGNGNGNVGGNGGGGARPGSPPCVPREGAPPPPAPPLADKQWNYPAATLDLMTTGAAFWQNYSGEPHIRETQYKICISTDQIL